MRLPFIAGNWKMHGSRASVQTLLEGIVAGAATLSAVELAVFPSFPFLEQTERLLKHSNIRFGAQNLNAAVEGAFTGEVSAVMLREFGCQYVIVGHSERRTLYGETDQIVAAKALAADEASLTPIVCVGENLQERQANQTLSIIERQLHAITTLSESKQLLSRIVIAYEPVWAIGTGLTATPAQAQEVHHFIRQQLAKQDKKVAERARILYGGSVKSENAAALFNMPDIDGGLIGGASLQAQSFLAIAQSCKQSC